MFYSGLRPQKTMFLDALEKGTVMMKSVEEVTTYIESLEISDPQVQYEKSQFFKKRVLELGTQDAILAQNELISQHAKDKPH